MSSERGGSRKRWVVGLVVIGGFGAFGLMSLNQSLAAYTHDFEDVRSRVGELLQVPGVVDKSVPAAHNAQAGTFEFDILGVEDRSQRLHVVSHQVKPGNFDQASQVICVGTFTAGVFDAQQLLVKCPSKEQQKMQAVGGREDPGRGS
jgi:cytochrome c-type biogenesis protein CcmE